MDNGDAYTRSGLVPASGSFGAVSSTARRVQKQLRSGTCATAPQAPDDSRRIRHTAARVQRPTAHRARKNAEFARMRQQMCRYLSALGVSLPPPPQQQQQRQWWRQERLQDQAVEAPFEACADVLQLQHGSPDIRPNWADGGPRSSGFSLQYANVGHSSGQLQALGPPTARPDYLAAAKHGGGDSGSFSDCGSELTLLEGILWSEEEEGDDILCSQQ